MKLTRAEKLILVNQYEILKGVFPNREKSCDLILAALYGGYEQDFEQLVEDFPDPIPQDVYKEVRDILQMYRALHPPQLEPHARFVGFDGNEESSHYAYAVFLLDDRQLWRESKRDNYNTHYPVLDKYREMLVEWNKTNQSFELTADEVARIVAKAPNASITE